MIQEEQEKTTRRSILLKNLAKKYSEVPEVPKSIQMYTNISENYLEVPQN